MALSAIKAVFFKIMAVLFQLESFKYATTYPKTIAKGRIATFKVNLGGEKARCRPELVEGRLFHREIRLRKSAGIFEPVL